MDGFSGTVGFLALAVLGGGAAVVVAKLNEMRHGWTILTGEVHGLHAQIAKLDRRLREIESRLAGMEPAPKPAAPPEIPVVESAPAAAPVEAPPQIPIPVPIPVPPPLPVPPPATPPAPLPAGRPIPVSLEEQLGARLPVWIGSIALALAGAFLVKYSFDKGLLSPPVRVAMGVLFGIGLLAGGELMRRSAERISHGLSAAGVADLFACFLAGVQLYHVIPPSLGFVLMALTTAVAVGLSLRQGKMVALIGMIGGFLTPYLIRTGHPDVRGLFAYLFLLQVGLLAVAWKRGWTEIAGLALGGGLLWTFVWVAGPFQPDDAVFLGLFLLLSVASVLVAGLARRSVAGEGPPLLALTWAAVPGALLALAVVAGQGGFSTTEWAFFAILAAGVLVLARLEPAFHPLAWVAAGAAATLLAAWAAEAHGPLHAQEPDRFLATAAALGALFAGGAYAAHLPWRGRSADAPGRWASLSAAAGIVFFLIAWGATREQRTGGWGAAALGGAVLYLVAALPVARRRRERPDDPGITAALAALAVAVTTFVSLAVPLQLERQWLTVAWALEVTALVWLAGKFRLPVLAGLARVMAILVAGRLLLNASVLDYPIGERPFFNWLLYGYGLPLLAFAAAAWLVRQQERQGEPADTRFATLLEAAALAFACALVTLEVRQLYHPGNPAGSRPDLAEAGSLVAAWALLGVGVLAVDRRTLLPSLEWGGRLLLAFAGGMAILLPGLLLNPLWDHGAVGERPIVNLLLWCHGVPAALLGAGIAELRRRGSRKLPAALTVVVLGLAFGLVTLEVRQAYHGTYLDAGPTSLAEGYTYSAAWILFGTALLILGVLGKGKPLRYAALAVMLVAILKVFLYDTANLSDLYRVFSFLGLGVSLLALAWIYQRFVFRENP